jgi:hypothetical protein
MKQYIVDRHTTPNTPKLEQVPTEKIPIYDDLDAAAADLANLAENQIIATHDTGSELSAPTDTVQSGNMHAVTSNAVAESLSYSETEQKTGGKWIDGKPIYRKVIKVNGNPSTIQTGLTSANEVIDFRIKNTVSGTDGSCVFNACLSSTNVYYPWLYQLSADNKILNRITGTYDGTTKFVILEYTKPLN